MIEDKPKVSIAEDVFHRTEMVEALVDFIKTCEVSRSATIGIVGKWGSGKTTIVNFIKECIYNDDSIVVIDFNPWIYSSQEDISVQLLKCLSFHTSPKRKKWLYRHLSTIRYFSNIACVISDGKLTKMMELFSELLVHNNEGMPLSELKKSISTKLSKLEKRIVIVIDDIDRLKKEEIEMVMKLVRSVSDFSNIIYILCYDRQIVENALNDSGFPGHEYLQKIIDLEVHIPEIDNEIVIRHLINDYLQITKKNTLDDYSSRIFDSLYNCKLSERDVCRIITKFELLYRISRNNTCSADLLALTIIDVKEPLIYIWISENRDRLCGVYIPLFKDMMEGKEEKIISLYENKGLNKDYSELLSVMFPYFNNNNVIQGDEVVEYRICKYRYVYNYFMLTPSSLAITDVDVDNLMMMHDPELFYNYVYSLNPDYLYEISLRVSEKIKSSPSNYVYSKILSIMILKQPFLDGKVIKINLLGKMLSIVLTYLNGLGEDVVKELISMCPDDVQKVIIFGANAYESIGNLSSRMRLSGVDSLYEKISEIIIRDIGSYSPDSIELLYSLIIVSKVDYDSARELFLRIKPSFLERAQVYEELKKLHISTDYLKKLSGDS